MAFARGGCTPILRKALPRHARTSTFRARRPFGEVADCATGSAGLLTDIKVPDSGCLHVVGTHCFPAAECGVYDI
jgi:hypothetical protein